MWVRINHGMIRRIEEYVRENMLGLPKLPKADDVAKIKKEQDAARVAAGDDAHDEGARRDPSVTGK